MTAVALCQLSDVFITEVKEILTQQLHMDICMQLLKNSDF